MTLPLAEIGPIRSFVARADVSLQALADEIKRDYPGTVASVLKLVGDTRFYSTHLSVVLPNYGDDSVDGIDLIVSFQRIGLEGEASFEACVILDGDPGTVLEQLPSDDRVRVGPMAVLELPVNEANLNGLLNELPRLIESTREYVGKRMARGAGVS